jgi:RNA polymerase sigma-70 factor (ECF subfamily)
MPDISHETEEVWNEVRRLPRRQAQAIALFYVGQLSIEEIAEVMDCQRGAVKSHLHRARTKLNQSLAAWDQETR